MKKGEESVTLRMANLLVILFSPGKNRIKLKLFWGIKIYICKVYTACCKCSLGARPFSSPCRCPGLGPHLAHSRARAVKGSPGPLSAQNRAGVLIFVGGLTSKQQMRKCCMCIYICMYTLYVYRHVKYTHVCIHYIYRHVKYTYVCIHYTYTWKVFICMYTLYIHMESIHMYVYVIYKKKVYICMYTLNIYIYIHILINKQNSGSGH